jgi:hypothetical protein
VLANKGWVVSLNALLRKIESELKADSAIQSKLSNFTACNIATKKKHAPIAKLLRSTMNYQQNFIQGIIHMSCLTEISPKVPSAGSWEA